MLKCNNKDIDIWKIKERINNKVLKFWLMKIWYNVMWLIKCMIMLCIILIYVFIVFNKFDEILKKILWLCCYFRSYDVI